MSHGNYHIWDGFALNISNILTDPINPEHVELADGYEVVKSVRVACVWTFSAKESIINMLRTKYKLH